MPAKKKLPKKAPGTTVKSHPGASKAKVRMYRHGLGDCFLIALPRKTARPFFILIDCGVIIGTQAAVEKINEVVADIASATNSHIDLLVITHEHWDHVSGFVQAKEAFEKLQIDEIWFGWTENPKDKLAQKLTLEHQKMRLALRGAATRMRIQGRDTSLVSSLLGFFGAAGGSTADAMKNVKALSNNIKYCLPSEGPEALRGTGARVYVLGPPRDEKLIRKCNPSKSAPETFEIAVKSARTLEDGIADGDMKGPFDPILQIPIDYARSMPFFATRYWGEADDGDLKDQSWRRIDGDWLDVSSSLALQLDSATNNTSLVIAIELEDGRVLLFAGDAQVGNWLSWQDLKWAVDGKEVTGPDLLRRTVYYKTGHHGSHNATLKDMGVVMMESLEWAFIPVFHEMAVKKGWNRMPLPSLEAYLKKATNDKVVRSDKPLPECGPEKKKVTDKPLYYELRL